MQQRYYLHTARIVYIFLRVLVSIYIYKLGFLTYFCAYVSIIPALLIIKNGATFLQLEQPWLLTLKLVVLAYQKLHKLRFRLRVYFDLKNLEDNEIFGGILEEIGASGRPPLLLNASHIFWYHIYWFLLVSFISHLYRLIRPVQSFFIFWGGLIGINLILNVNSKIFFVSIDGLGIYRLMLRLLVERQNLEYFLGFERCFNTHLVRIKLSV
jgi:hypothetical protein